MPYLRNIGTGDFIVLPCCVVLRHRSLCLKDEQPSVRGLDDGVDVSQSVGVLLGAEHPGLRDTLEIRELKECLHDIILHKMATVEDSLGLVRRHQHRAPHLIVVCLLRILVDAGAQNRGVIRASDTQVPNHLPLFCGEKRTINDHGGIRPFKPMLHGTSVITALHPHSQFLSAAVLELRVEVVEQHLGQLRKYSAVHAGHLQGVIQLSHPPLYPLQSLSECCGHGWMDIGRAYIRQVTFEIAH